MSPPIPAAFAAEMQHPDFPRASAYDPTWVYCNVMGPNSLWLTDALTQTLRLEPGMRVLDLGCGAAITSIFLAREFDVQVWAADLWIEPSLNTGRIEEAGVGDRVFPIEAEAHTLPFAHAFFDAIVSIDSFHYYGTDVRYLSYLAQFVRPGGAIGIVVPGERDRSRRSTGRLPRTRADGRRLLHVPLGGVVGDALGSHDGRHGHERGDAAGRSRAVAATPSGGRRVRRDAARGDRRRSAAALGARPRPRVRTRHRAANRRRKR